MSIERHIGRMAGVLVALHAGQLCGAAAQELSLAGGATHLNADANGLSASGDMRASLGAMTGDSDAEQLSRVRGGYDYHSDGDSRFWAETIQPLEAGDSVNFSMSVSAGSGIWYEYANGVCIDTGPYGPRVRTGFTLS